MSVQTQNTNLNPYSNTPIKNLEYIQNKALVIAPFEITKSGLLDTDLMLDTPGTITMYFFRKNFNDIDKEPTAEQFKTVGTVSDISAKLGLDITASNISSSITSSYYLGFTKISVIFKYDKNTGMRIIEKDNSLLQEDYIDIGIDNTIDLTNEDYFVICNVTKNTKATNSGFTESSSLDFLFMIPSSECQEIITDFDILDSSNNVINVKKYGALGSGFVANNDITIEPAYQADFFKDGSNIATYLFNGNCNDETGSYNGTGTGISYVKGKFGQAATFSGSGTDLNSSISLPKLIFGPSATSGNLSIWINPNTSNLNRQTLYVESSSILWPSLYIDIINGSQFRINIHNGIVWSNYNICNVISDWQHIYISLVGTNLKVYLNGTMVFNQTAVTPSSTISGTSLIGVSTSGVSGSYGSKYTGQIDNVRIFNRPLNQREVLDLYKEQPSYEEQLTLTEVTGKTLTPSGNPLVVYDKVAGPSIKFDGVSYFTIPSSNDFSFGTGDFTVECLINTSSQTNQMIFDTVIAGQVGAQTGRLAIYLTATGKVEIYNGSFLTSTNSILYTQTNHIAITRTNSILKIFINGVVGYSASVVTDFTLNNCTIGKDLASNGTYSLIGNLIQFHIIKGVSKYSADFTPASRLTSTTNTVLLIQVDKTVVNTDNWSKIQLESVETIQAPSIVEQTGKVITNTGVTIDTTDSGSKFPNGSLSFKGSNYLTFDATNILNFGTNDFTIEFWYYTNSSTHYNIIMGIDNNNNSYPFALEVSSIRGFAFHSYTTFLNYRMDPNISQWKHYVITRTNGSILTLFIDGINVATSNISVDTVYNFTNMYIGKQGNYYANGVLNDFRISNISRYNTTNFTPPTSGLVKDTNTIFLLQAANPNQPLSIKDPKRKDFFGDKSMVACYMLDSNANDETGMYNGTLSGSNFTFTSGKFGQCISVNNTNYVDLPETLSTIFGTNDFSISLWFKPSDTLVTHNILFATHSSNSPGFLTILLMDNKILTGVFDGSSRPSITHQDNILLTDWNHVVVTKESNIYKIYSNNVVSSTTLTSALSIACGDIRIGQNPAAPSLQYFNGQIDNVKIFNRALTDSEVTSLYDETISPIITLETETETIASEPDFFNDKSNIATYLFDNDVNDANGKYSGTATNITYGAGKFGNCANFDGTSSIKSKLDLSGLNSYTMSVWVKKNTIGSHFNMGQGVLTSAGVTSTGPRCELLWYHDGYLYAECGSNHSNWNKYLPPVIDTNWHHLLYTFNNGIINMYFDGGLLSLASSSGTISTTVPIFTSQDFVIGLRSTGNTLGQIDNVRIFNRALTQTEVQDLYRETKRVKYKAITLDANNFGPVSKFSIETQKEIKLLNYKTWTGTDATFQGYRIYPVMNISDHTTEETTFNPKYYLGTKYQRNLSEILSQGIKSKRTISNLKDMYLVDDLCIQTLKKINILLENDQMIKFSERLYNLATPLREKLNADLILDYLSAPVSGSQNSDIAATLKTSLIEDYNFTQDEIDNLNDNLNTFKSRARININTPMVQGSGLDQLRFTLPKTFIDGNRSKTEKKNLLVFGTDAGFNKFGLSGYSAPYSNISRRETSSALVYSDLIAGLTTLGALEDVSTIKDVQQNYGDETLNILFENGNLYAGRYVQTNNSYVYCRDGNGISRTSFGLKLIKTNVKSMACLMLGTFIIDNNNDVWATGGYTISSNNSIVYNTYDIFGINSSGYLPSWTKIFPSSTGKVPKKIIGMYSTTVILTESGEVFGTGGLPNWYTLDGVNRTTQTWVSLGTGVTDINCGDACIVYTMQNGDIYVGDYDNRAGVTIQGNNTSTINTKALKIITTWLPTGTNIVKTECTNQNVYFLLSNGDVYGAGLTRGGQLQSSPSSNTNGISTPIKLYSNVKRIIPQLFGRNNVCSVSMVELNTGEIKAAGNTSDYKFGYFVDYDTGVTTPVTLFSKVDKIFLTERTTIAIINGVMYLAGYNRMFGEITTNKTFLETKPLIAISSTFKDILTKYKQQIPFTYIPLSTDAANTNNEPVFENLTDITGFNNSDIIIDVPNVL